MTFAYHSILYFILWLKESSFHRFFYGFPYLCRRSSKAEKSPGKRRHSLAAKLNFLNLWRLLAKSSELFPVFKSSQRSLDGLHCSARQLTGWLFLTNDKQAELYQPRKTNGWTFSSFEDKRQNILTVGGQQINLHHHKKTTC